MAQRSIICGGELVIIGPRPIVHLLLLYSENRARLYRRSASKAAALLNM